MVIHSCKWDIRRCSPVENLGSAAGCERSMRAAASVSTFAALEAQRSRKNGTDARLLDTDQAGGTGPADGNMRAVIEVLRFSDSPSRTGPHPQRSKQRGYSDWSAFARKDSFM